MNDKFDELAKGLAQSVTQRQALRRFGVGLAGVQKSTTMKTQILIVMTMMLVMVVGEITSLAQAEDGEVWVTSQGTDRLFILHGQGAQGGVETITLPPTTGPHITAFSPEGKYAYVCGMGNGDLDILRANDRQLVTRLSLGTVLTHQAKPSPDGATLLVAQIASAQLIKVAADEASESWTVQSALSFAPLSKAPICTVFRDDGARAYVSLRPNGLAIVDVPTLALLGTLPTDGFIACGMIKSKDGRTITIASSGSGGHIYRLDTATDTLTDAGTIGAADWHSFNMSVNEKVGFGSSPGSDELRIIDLQGPTVSTIAALALDPTPGIGNDQPDAIGVRGNTAYVSLRAAGKLAIIEVNQRKVSYLDLSPPAPFSPVTCAGCAVHGVAVRP